MSKTPIVSKEFEVLILGGGVAGSIAASVLTKNGVKVAIVDRPGGATLQSSGAVDVAHAHSDRPMGYVEAAAFMAHENIYHPYSQPASSHLPRIKDALFELKDLAHDVELMGQDNETNLLLATQLGTVKHSAMVQKTQAFDLRTLSEGDSLLVLGFSGLPSFNARSVARMLKWSIRTATHRDIQVLGVEVDLQPQTGSWRSPLEMALSLDEETNASRFESAVRQGISNCGVKYGACLLPPVAGRTKYRQIWRALNEKQALPVYELLAMPHSTPGLRLHDALKMGLDKLKVERIAGEAISSERIDRKIAKVLVETSDGFVNVAVGQVILATGRFFSGGFEREGKRQERIFRLPLWHQGKLVEQAHVSTLSTNGAANEQAIFCSGLAVDEKMRPVDQRMELFALNLFAAGSSIGGYDTSGKGSGLGLAAYLGYMSAFHTMKNTFRE